MKHATLLSDDQIEEILDECDRYVGTEDYSFVFARKIESKILSIIAPHRRFQCWSSNEGDTWYDYPCDSQIIEDIFFDDAPEVGAEYELTAGWNSVTARYRIISVDGNGDCEVECVSHPQENEPIKS